ncbi:nitrate/nitrite transporter NrtS [Roseivirga misakiensis]|uniref:nitrate/nitrite transporter NrtS n=1 Tax=Roseivirga misakiensis TaxID=1563681 RepID=UPI00373FD997
MGQLRVHNKKRNLLKHIFSDKSNLVLAIKMSLVVGTILNCINQGECLVNQELDQLNLPKLLITYSVPFFVSLYSTTIIKFKR